MATSEGFTVEMKLIDNSPEALKQLAVALEKGLTKCGLLAERTAKLHCPVAEPWRWKVPVTNYIGGTLKGSIVFALDGEKPTNEDGKNGYANPNKDKHIPGRYSGNAPKERKSGYRAVYVGTNVYYAPYVESGTMHMPARPFIRPAFVENAEQFKKFLRAELEGLAVIT